MIRHGKLPSREMYASETIEDSKDASFHIVRRLEMRRNAMRARGLRTRVPKIECAPLRSNKSSNKALDWPTVRWGRSQRISSAFRTSCQTDTITRDRAGLTSYHWHAHKIALLTEFVLSGARH